MDGSHAPTVDAPSQKGGVYVETPSRKNPMRYTSYGKLLACLLPLVLSWHISAGAAIASAAAPPPDAAVSLHAKYAALRDELTRSQFDRPVYLESNEASGDLKSDVYALVGYQFPTVTTALTWANQWCEVLILHLNVKGCRASPEATAGVRSIFTSVKNMRSHWMRRRAWIFRIVSSRDRATTLR